MSDIDLKEPIFQDELALSENQSLPGNSQSRQLRPEDRAENSAHQKKDLLTSGYRSYRFSETTSSQRSSPLKIGNCLLRSTDHSSSQPANWLPLPTEKRGDFSLFSPNNENQVFECQHKLYSNMPCEICKGQGVVKADSNLVKFFEYIISFKLRVKESYTQKKKLSQKSKAEVNAFCQEFYAQETECEQIRGTSGVCTYKPNRLSVKPNKGMTSSYSIGSRSKYKDPSAYEDACRAQRNSYCDRSLNDRRSEYDRVKEGRCSYQERTSFKNARKCNKSDVVEELSTMLVIHEGYCCDLCQSSPIIGPRFHCQQCEDYDLCEECYFHYDHKHPLQKIDKTAKGKQLQNIITMLVEPSRESIGRVSLRPPPTIGMEPLSGKTTKSAIR